MSVVPASCLDTAGVLYFCSEWLNNTMAYHMVQKSCEVGYFADALVLLSESNYWAARE